jgi:hypothetical protein
VDDFWLFMKGEMLEVLYWEPWFQGDVARSVLPAGRNGGSLTLKGPGKNKN